MTRNPLGRVVYQAADLVEVAKYDESRTLRWMRFYELLAGAFDDHDEYEFFLSEGLDLDLRDQFFADIAEVELAVAAREAAEAITDAQACGSADDLYRWN
jgi:hypothetical protein